MNKPFRYEAMWESHEEFFLMVERAWKDTTNMGCSSVESMKTKLERLASALAAWGSTSFGHVRKEMWVLKKKLSELKVDPLRFDPSYEEKKIEERLIELNFCEELMCRQRSRIQWLAEGDESTQKIHQKATIRRRKNRIQDENKLSGMVTEFYENLYK